MQWEAAMVFPTSTCAWLPLPSPEAEDAEKGLRRNRGFLKLIWPLFRRVGREAQQPGTLPALCCCCDSSYQLKILAAYASLLLGKASEIALG